MLHRVLEEIEAAAGPMEIDELGRRLGVDRSALEGMVDFWVRKGRLRDDRSVGLKASLCGTGACGVSCPGPQGCPFIVPAPRTYSLIALEED